jgi:7,8-dihydroneopterin aldolase/epimerase/oxygenase
MTTATPSVPDLGTSTNYASQGIRHVLVRQLEIMTTIGVHDYEKRAPQRIHVWVDLAVREAGPVISDRLEDVLDYAEVVRRVEQRAKSGHVNLLETLAERIAADCLEDIRVLAARIRIEKPDVIAHAQSVGIEIERRRP